MAGFHVKNIQGERFGQERELEALSYLGTKLYGDAVCAVWLFKCHRCGELLEKHTRNMRSAQSCGSTSCRKHYSRLRRGITKAG